MKITFVRASEDDAFRLINLQNIAFKADYTKYGHCPSYNEPVDNMKKHITNKICYIINADGEDAGNIIMMKRADGSYYLRVLAIIPRFQNLHIGKKAIEFLEQNHTESNIWELTTPKDRVRNCHFYESNGYIKVGEKIDNKNLTLNIYQKRICR